MWFEPLNDLLVKEILYLILCSLGVVTLIASIQQFNVSHPFIIMQLFTQLRTLLPWSRCYFIEQLTIFSAVEVSSYFRIFPNEHKVIFMFYRCRRSHVHFCMIGVDYNCWTLWTDPTPGISTRTRQDNATSRFNLSSTGDPCIDMFKIK